MRPSSDRSLKGQQELEPGLLQPERVQALGLQRVLERGPVLELELEPRAQRVPQLQEL